MVNIILLLFLWAAFQAADAQSLTHISASALGGSAAGVAGKGVSDGLNAVGNVLGKAAKAAGEPAVKEKKKGRMAPFLPPEPSLSSANTAPQQDPGPAGGAAPARSGASRSRADAGNAKQRPAGGAPLRATAGTNEPKPEPVRISHALPQLEAGASRQDVTERLGQPAGRITSFDDQGLVEVYSFREGRNQVGSVRLVNGKVTEVKVAQ